MLAFNHEVEMPAGGTLFVAVGSYDEKDAATNAAEQTRMVVRGMAGPISDPPVVMRVIARPDGSWWTLIVSPDARVPAIAHSGPMAEAEVCADRDDAYGLIAGLAASARTSAAAAAMRLWPGAEPLHNN